MVQYLNILLFLLNNSDKKDIIIKENIVKLVSIQWSDDDCPRTLFSKLSKFLIDNYSLVEKDEVLISCTDHFNTALQNVDADDPDALDELFDRGRNFYGDLVEGKNTPSEVHECLRSLMQSTLERFENYHEASVIKFLSFLTQLYTFKESKLADEFVDAIYAEAFVSRCKGPKHIHLRDL
eukprot:UN23588